MVRLRCGLMIAVSLLLGSWTQALAVDTASYFPLSEGRAWIFDREILLMSGKNHSFASVTAQELCQASVLDTTLYMDNGLHGVRIVGTYDRASGQFNDWSTSPAVLAPANMDVGQSVSSTLPDGVRVKSTLDGRENVTGPAGNFPDTLRFVIDINDGNCTYQERIWVARNTGYVKLERVSETPRNCNGCFLTCGSFNADSSLVVSRVQQLDTTVKPARSVVIIP